MLYAKGQPENLRYILGLLNSRLLTFRFKFIGKLKSGGIVEYFWNSVSQLPIRRIDFSNQGDREHHEQMVSLVSHVLSLLDRLGNAKTEHDKQVVRRQILATDRKIDRLVYDLYGLTDEEIAVVEVGSTAAPA